MESFKSSTQPCNPRARAAFHTKPSFGRSVSFDATHLLHGNDSIRPFQRNGTFDAEDLSAEDVANCNELPMERDMGDGSSDANSMTNLSDVYERDNDDGIDEQLSMDAHDYEQGRKSATGASSHGDDVDTTLEHQEKQQQQQRQQDQQQRRSPKFESISNASTIIDAINIFKKYLLNGELNNLVAIPTEILSRISLALCVQFESGPMQCTANNTFDLSLSSESMPFTQLEQTNVVHVFDDAQAFVLHHLDRTFTAGFLESSFFYRFCSENDGQFLKIADILHNEMALFYFMEFMENEGKRQYVDFWLGAMNFKQQLDPLNTTAITTTTTPTSATPHDSPHHTTPASIEISQKDALILYDKYFSLQATQPLLLSDQVRYHVEEKICSIDGAVSVAHCFDLPLLIVERFLDDRYLTMFRQRSQLFGRYMMEVQRKLDAVKLKMSSNRIESNVKRSPSSISSKNTLLAMENVKKRHGRQQRIHSSTSDMCIDSRQLHDPDLLWRRSSTTASLCFGRVNEFGRYERNYDMTPFDKHNSTLNNNFGSGSGSNGTGGGGGGGSGGGSGGGANENLDTILQNTSNKIKRAVRKWVHLPEQCMQEELAWQMAEMIIKDVTSVTLQPNECK